MLTAAGCGSAAGGQFVKDRRRAAAAGRQRLPRSGLVAARGRPVGCPVARDSAVRTRSPSHAADDRVAECTASCPLSRPVCTALAAVFTIGGARSHCEGAGPWPARRSAASLRPPSRADTSNSARASPSRETHSQDGYVVVVIVASHYEILRIICWYRSYMQL